MNAACFSDCDASRKRENDSPELQRRASQLDENVLGQFEALNISWDYPIDIKNSTILPHCDAKNISEISKIDCSPISFPARSLSLDDLEWTMSDLQSTQTYLSSTKSSENIGCLNRSGSKHEMSLHNANGKILNASNNIDNDKISSSEKDTCAAPSKSLAQFNESGSPEKIGSIKGFVTQHHSCLTSPPTHWFNTPVAVRRTKYYVKKHSNGVNSPHLLLARHKSRSFLPKDGGKLDNTFKSTNIEHTKASDSSKSELESSKDENVQSKVADTSNEDKDSAIVTQTDDRVKELWEWVAKVMKTDKNIQQE